MEMRVQEGLYLIWELVFFLGDASTATLLLPTLQVGPNPFRSLRSTLIRKEQLIPAATG